MFAKVKKCHWFCKEDPVSSSDDFNCFVLFYILRRCTYNFLSLAFEFTKNDLENNTIVSLEISYSVVI